MTELSFLIDLLLNHKLPKPVKSLVADRIKEIEEKQKPMTPQPLQPLHQGMGSTMQAASTMANMNRLETMAMAPAPIAAQRVVGGEVDTGKGLRGPRKF